VNTYQFIFKWLDYVQLLPDTRLDDAKLSRIRTFGQRLSKADHVTFYSLTQDVSVNARLQKIFTQQPLICPSHSYPFETLRLELCLQTYTIRRS